MRTRLASLRCGLERALPLYIIDSRCDIMQIVFVSDDAVRQGCT